MYVAAEHARRIRDRFAAAELQIVLLQHDRRAAQLAHRDLETHARAGGIFLENHGQRFAGERPLLRPARAFAPARLGEDFDDVALSEVAQVEEMAHTIS